MEMSEIIKQAEENIRQAIEDYRRHTHQTEVLDNISNAFIKRLAEDSSRAKSPLLGGVWIEIITRFRSFLLRWSPLLGGVWIEIFENQLWKSTVDKSPLLGGVWIEIHSIIY